MSASFEPNPGLKVGGRTGARVGEPGPVQSSLEGLRRKLGTGLLNARGQQQDRQIIFPVSKSREIANLVIRSRFLYGPIPRLILKVVEFVAVSNTE